MPLHSILHLVLTLSVTYAFCPSISSPTLLGHTEIIDKHNNNSRRTTTSTSSSFSSFSSSAVYFQQENNLPDIVETSNTETSILFPIQLTEQEEEYSKKKPSLIQDLKQHLTTRWKVLQNTFSSFRPANKFRIGLGVTLMTFLSIASLIAPTSRLLVGIQSWLSHRGFQGLAALGRSIAYGWALFIGYPRLLDRRQMERQHRDKVRVRERHEKLILQLRSEVSQFQQNLETIDAEIRSFRREIINLKAFAKDDNPDVQEAITAEMAHLAHLRSDAQAALTAARQEWAKALGKYNKNTNNQDGGDDASNKSNIIIANNKSLKTKL